MVNISPLVVMMGWYFCGMLELELISTHIMAIQVISMSIF